MGIVCAVGQFQEQVLERGMLRRGLVDAGIRMDQRIHQLGDQLCRERDRDTAWPVDLRGHPEARDHFLHGGERFGLDQQARFLPEQVGDPALSNQLLPFSSRPNFS